MPATVPVHEKNFTKDLVVPPQLQGCKALKYEEGGLAVIPVTIAVDPNCFYFYWTDQHRKSECLELSSVRDTRIGEKKARLPRDPKLLQLCLIGNATDRETPLEEKCLTIVCGTSYVDLRFISFIFAKRSEAHFWTTELFQVAYNYRTQNLGLERTLLKIYTKLKITASPEIRISVKDIIQYFYSDKDDRKRCEKALESHKNDPILLEKFQFKDFLRLYSQIVPRPDLETIFAQCIGQFGTKNAKSLNAEQLKNFLNRSQRDPRLNEILHPHATIETARALIDKYEPHESFRQQYHLSLEGFVRFLMSDSNAIISSTCYTMHQDMNQPLSHYMINSSHNTYLLGAQIKGKSSAEMYRQALLSGCRCVELDCWNGEDGEPIITHGRTLTIPITIKEALDAIADYAFKTSDYPVILSLENRCSAQLQDKLARYLKRAFGSALLDKAVQNHPLESGTALPSPDSLKNKILIKNKKKAPTVGSTVNFPSSAGDPRTPEDPIANNDSDTDDEAEDVDAIPDSLPPNPEGPANNAPAEKPAAAAVAAMVETELSALVVYVQPTRFDSFDAAKKRNRGYECVSLVEDRAMMLLKKDPVHFIDFNKRQLTRIYPNATRVKSTNFLPFFFWSSGCQLVALNVQTPDLGMQLNTAVFEFNGLSGYILKPELMRRKDRTLDPFTESHLDGVVPASLSVRIVSGLMLSFKRISTFVEVDMYGIFGDIKKKDHRTRTCLSNGMNPQYDQVNQPFLFRVTLPEMAYLRISVREERTSRLIGHTLLPVNQIRPGYRHVVLKNEIGQTLAATVFILIEVKDYIPTYQIDLANALENPIRHQTEHDRKEKLIELLNVADDPEDLPYDSDAVDNGMPRNSPSSTSGRASPLPSARMPSSSSSQNGSPHPVTRPPPSISSTSSNERERPPNAIKLPVDENHNKLPGSNTPGTPGPKRASLVPENPDDLKAHQRLQVVRAPTLEEIKKQSKSLQKLVLKQDKEMEALQKKYAHSVKKLEAEQTKEHEKLILDQEKSRAAFEKRKVKVSAASLLPTDADGDMDGLIKHHESQRWAHLKKQAEQMAALKRDHFAKENQINRKYHEMFYHTLEEELQQQHVTLNEQLKNVNTVNVNEMLKKLSEQASKELHDLKQNKAMDKSQLDQSRDDLKQKNVRQGVAIGKKYETMFEDRKKTLVEEMDVVLHQLKREKMQVEHDLEAKFNEKCQKLHEDLQNSLPNRHVGDGDGSRS